MANYLIFIIIITNNEIDIIKQAPFIQLIACNK